MQKVVIITRKVVTEKTEEVSINLPAFFRKGTNAFFKVISASELIEIQLYTQGYFFMHRDDSEFDVKNACGYDPIDQIEFLKSVEAMLLQHNNALNVIIEDAPVLDMTQQQFENLQENGKQ